MQIKLSDFSDIIFDGTALEKVIYDGATVWEHIKHITTPITLFGQVGGSYGVAVTGTSAVIEPISPIKMTITARDTEGSTNNLVENVTVEGLNSATNAWETLFVVPRRAGYVKNTAYTFTNGEGIFSANSNYFKQFRATIASTRADLYRYVGPLIVNEYYQK